MTDPGQPSKGEHGAWRPDIALMIADVDGTLVTPDKTLTPRAAEAVRRLGAAGVAFTLISSRPPRGMAALVSALDIRLPFAAFNGGSLVSPDLTILEAHRLAPGVARATLDLLAARGVDPWVFAGGAWFLRDPEGSNVPRERRAVGFDPIVVESFGDFAGAIDKIVGVSDDHALLARVDAEALALLAGRATIQRSQPYYLDVTHPLANKGDGVVALCARAGADPSRTAVIGDMFNDVAMFRRAGFSIAMGQAPPEVAAHADVVTLANTREGFAEAVDRLLLAQAVGARA